MLERTVKLRKSWVINPRTRVKSSKKVYSRPKAKLEAKRIINGKE
ncbi:MAG: hypothetical protein PHO03_05710 [Candidatus Omnitrophica bacterium]|nr:hypothetical protein [Candidatus Omnitrophota bacterium]